MYTGLDTYMVQWECRERYKYADGAVLSKRYQAFTDKQEANDFVEALRRAYNLLGDKGFSVTVTKMVSNGVSD